MNSKHPNSLLATLITHFTENIADKLGTIPGNEFKVAYDEGLKINSNINLIDRPVDVFFQK
jgi:pheromone shutdown protein TraB